MEAILTNHIINLSWSSLYKHPSPISWLLMSRKSLSNIAKSTMNYLVRSIHTYSSKIITMDPQLTTSISIIINPLSWWCRTIAVHTSIKIFLKSMAFSRRMKITWQCFANPHPICRVTTSSRSRSEAFNSQITIQIVGNQWIIAFCPRVTAVFY